MHKIALSYALATASQAGAPIGNPLMDLLQAVRVSGSISGAAKAMGLSYRHVWGELRRWEKDLGQALIVWDKGQPARLTEFGDKLLWAERQAQARLAPQIEALHSDLERVFAVAFDDQAHVLSLYASHDDALVALRDHGARERLHLDIRFTGSVDAIAALNQGRCTLAGFHTASSPVVGSLAQRTYGPLLQPGRHKIIGFARRVQGLAVAPGNPLGLRSLHDVSRQQARFVNRERGSGTRLLLEQLMADVELPASALRGWDRTEPSHAAAAQVIASGAADTSLVIEAAARARGLGFVPLVSEDYYLVCLKSTLEAPPMQGLRALLRSDEWQARLAQLPGYAAESSGQVLSLSARLPWWRFRTTTARSPN